MMHKIKPLWFYSIVTVVTATVWFSLMEFARLPTGVDKRFVSTIFMPYFFLTVALCGWYEARRNKGTGRKK